MKQETRRILQTNREMLENSPKNLQSLFRITFHDRDRIMCETNDGFRIQKYTYGQMHDRICKVAAAFYAKNGVTGEYIALEMENSPDWIVGFWAILMSGNKPYLVNTRYPASLTQGILETLHIRYILCNTPTQLPGQAVLLAELTGDYPAVPEDLFADELALSSSATSMNEVICFYSGLQISAQILNFKQIVKENPQIAGSYKNVRKQLAFLPFYHIFGLFAVYFWFSFFGQTFVFLRDYSADTILKTCRRHQVTHIFAVPMLWHSIEKQVRSQVAKQGAKTEAKFYKALAFCTKLQNVFPKLGATVSKRLLRQVTDKLFGPSVIFCINGGSYLRDSAIELLNGLGYNMHNGYGMSEIGITSVDLHHRPKDKNRNSIGHPFEAVEYRLDENGILQVRGGTLCTRKLVNGVPVAPEDWFDTGDLMECRDGQYYIRGRRSDTVIGENGENINPDMIEKAFIPEQVQQFCVLGLEENGQESLALVAQLNPYTTQAMASRIKAYFYSVNDTLPTATAVKKFYFTFDELAPPTAVKVSRAQLLKKIQNGDVKLVSFQQFRAEDTAEGEQSPLLRQVCQIIAQVLDMEVDAVGSDSHIFYDLGATSIQYFSIISALAEQFSLTDAGSSETYRYTPREICEYIERNL